MTVGVWRSFLAKLYQEVFIKEKQWCQDFGGYNKSVIVEMKNPAASSGVSSLEWKFILLAGVIHILYCWIIHIRKQNLTAAKLRGMSPRLPIKAGTKTRLEYQHDPNLIGQFYIGAGVLKFR